ncbi:MAG: ferritin family protein [Elusimicrobia bacterium]|nr:ferritin family protein [Elusimicrobiota bacterium]
MEGALSPQDLIKLAIAMEEGGQKLYAKFERETADERLKQTWGLLRRQEIEHAVEFRKLLRVAELSQPAESSSAEASPYQRAVAAASVLMGSRLGRTSAGAVLSDLDALALAIAVEKDTILTYMALKDQILGDRGHALDKILAEEQSHLIQLTELLDSQPERFPVAAPDLPTGL